MNHFIWGLGLLSTCIVPVCSFAHETFSQLLTPDTIVKQRAFYCPPGCSGQKLSWDFSNLHVEDDAYEVKYFYPNVLDSSTICGIEHRTRYLYKCDIDTLYFVGMDDPTSIYEFDKPEIMFVSSMDYGDTIKSSFSGKGQYCHLLPMKIEGSTLLVADADGQLIMPDYTYPNVLRTHAVREYIRSGFDSTKIFQDNYRWYLGRYPHPVLESVSVYEIIQDSLGNDVNEILEQTSFYYSLPETILQEYSTSRQNDITIISPADTIFTEASFLPNPVESKLAISYKLSRDATIGYRLHNSSSTLMYSQPAMQRLAGANTDYVPMDGLLTGAYTLYILVDQYLLRQVIIKK